MPTWRCSGKPEMEAEVNELGKGEVIHELNFLTFNFCCPFYSGIRYSCVMVGWLGQCRLSEVQQILRLTGIVCTWKIWNFLNMIGDWGTQGLGNTGTWEHGLGNIGTGAGEHWDWALGNIGTGNIGIREHWDWGT